MTSIKEFQIAPEAASQLLTEECKGIDHSGSPISTRVVKERPITLYLNRSEIVTVMTIGDYPEFLALGYLANQQMLSADDEIVSIDIDDDLGVVVVRTKHETNYDDRMRRLIRTSGCAVGSMFGNIEKALDKITLPQSEIKLGWLYELTKKISTRPSLYLSAGAIHGSVLCWQNKPLIYMEDIGRHNAVDKIAGFMLRHGSEAADKILYTTGRLTSEIVIKTALMGIPALVSRSGFTAWGVELANKVGLTLVGRLRGQRFQCMSGKERLVFDV